VQDEATSSRSFAIGRARYPVLLPGLDDPRLHLAGVLISIHVLGQLTLGFAVSIPQILAAVGACAGIELIVTLTRDRVIAWPASAMLTGSGVALILRDVGTEAGDYWATRNWWLFAAVAAGSLATKYLIRWRGSHLFNPSNIGLVVAFLVLGSGRVEPLDFWWGELDAGTVLAYTIIVTGGLLITDQLRLLEMAGAFTIAFALVMGSLAVSGHSMTAAWSLEPIEDWHFWWIVVTSPETLIFLFFMITDPRIVPESRRGRLAFATAVAVASGLFMAPQSTEFGAKVGLLAGLAAVCATGPILHALFQRTGARSNLYRLTHRGPAVVLASLALIVTALAGFPARNSASTVRTDGVPGRSTLVSAVDADRLPRITADSDVAIFSQDLLGRGALRVAEDLVTALDIEALALREHNSDILASVDHGERLRNLETLVESSKSQPYDMRVVYVRTDPSRSCTSGWPRRCPTRSGVIRRN